jgi:Ca2+-binding RTX toxin-like protein
MYLKICLFTIAFALLAASVITLVPNIVLAANFLCDDSGPCRGTDSNDNIVLLPSFPSGGSVFAGPGNDKMVGNSDPNFMIGDSDNDIIDGKEECDMVTGAAGNDIVKGGPGDDTQFCFQGSGGVFGASGDDTVLGEDGNDLVRGGTGTDLVKGGNGNDLLFHGILAQDFTEPDFARDIISCGPGDDTAVINVSTDGDVAASDCETVIAG